MGTSHPVSGRKLRQSLGETISRTDEQRLALARTIGVVQVIGRVLNRGFWGRLHWLIFGLPQDKA